MMHMDNKKLIIGCVVAVAAIVIVAIFFMRGGGMNLGFSQEVSTESPINTTLNFFDPWLAAVQAESTDPYQEGLHEYSILSAELRAHIAGSRGGDVDPVLCRSVDPEQLSARPVYTRDDEAKVLITSSNPEQFEQSIVTLMSHNNGWYISGIECAAGEFAPEREFTFEQKGFLLKSVPAPYDSNRWHIVFEQDGQAGFVAPLSFNGGSMCSGGGSETVCDQNSFVEPSEVMVRGQMTETGVEVQKLEFVE